MILRRANIYDSNDIAKVHVSEWNDFYKDRVSEDFLNHFDFEYRKKYWIKFINENRICFVVEEKGGSIDGFIVPKLKRLNPNENIGEIMMQYVNHNSSYNQNVAILLYSCAKLFLKNKANSMYTWVHRESDYVDKYKELSGIETDAKVERMDSKDIIKLKIEWHELDKLIEKHDSVFNDIIIEF